MMRPLLLSDEVAERVRTLVTWADRPENWWHPYRDSEPPGDNPAYCIHLEVGFRCVYSMTVMPLTGKRVRHLSVSVPGEKFPDPCAVYTLATLFGFTGGVQAEGLQERVGVAALAGVTVAPAPDWLMKASEDGDPTPFVEIGQYVDGGPAS